MGAVVGVTIAIAAAIVGILVWRPGVGWPEWYIFLWVPALFLVAWPAPRWAVIAGTAIVAGTAAGLVTWGAELDARMTAARRELARLGDVQDDLATPYLERFAEQLLAGPEPASASTMYVMWRSSLLAGQEYPVLMGLWEPDGTRSAELSLDALDLPDATSGRPGEGTRLHSNSFRGDIEPDPRPALHPAAAPAERADPQLRRGAPHPVARPQPAGPVAPRAIGGPATLRTLPGAALRAGALEIADNRWTRSGVEIRTDRLIDLPGGSRHVHALIELRPLSMLLVRGALHCRGGFFGDRPAMAGGHLPAAQLAAAAGPPSAGAFVSRCVWQ